MACSHGMPTPASCVECMMDGPVGPAAPAETQMLHAERWMPARFDSRCARHHSHPISAGDRIGYVEDVGWCCEDCAV